MKKSDLRTPAVIVDLDALENNIARFQSLCDSSGKQLWPMTKTHKSSEIAGMQRKAGASGFLCGTLDECEKLAGLGVTNIMYAYPVAGAVSIGRALALASKGGLILRLDCVEAAQALQDAAAAAGVTVAYTVIIDSGLHRFGVPPEEAALFTDRLKGMRNLAFRGISTHPGHVYGAAKPEEVARCAEDEKNSLALAKTALAAGGHRCEIVGSGSTPTFVPAVDDANITHYHPGNYVFFDAVQMALGAATEKDCALSVLATVISRPAPDRLIIDAGAKCLGLDQGAHGNDSLKGYGHIKGRPGLEIYSLSEEVGKIRTQPGAPLAVGDRVEIIPNHSCSSANLTSWLVGCRGDNVEKAIWVDIRSNAATPETCPSLACGRQKA